ncbi:MAG TPA: GNAT family N-acetyltransferase [Vicinamibacterales bacterium]
MSPAAVAAGALRRGTREDAAAIHALITRYQAAGRLLPRVESEIARHAGRFRIAADGGVVLGCAELAPLSSELAEIRSLVVDESVRRLGLGRRLVQTLAEDAVREGFTSICAFTHDPSFFVRLGYSIVPHAWLPAKIAADCAGCPLFRQCGQTAVELRLDARGRRGLAA